MSDDVLAARLKRIETKLDLLSRMAIMVKMILSKSEGKAMFDDLIEKWQKLDDERGTDG